MGAKNKIKQINLNKNRQILNWKSYPGDLDNLAIICIAEVRDGHPIEKQKQGATVSEIVQIPQHKPHNKGRENEEESEGEGVVDDHKNEEGNGQAGEEEKEEEAGDRGRDRVAAPPAPAGRGGAGGEVVHRSDPTREFPKERTLFPS